VHACASWERETIQLLRGTYDVSVLCDPSAMNSIRIKVQIMHIVVEFYTGSV
jgi:hypothetical protein